MSAHSWTNPAWFGHKQNYLAIQTIIYTCISSNYFDISIIISKQEFVHVFML